MYARAGQLVRPPLPVRLPIIYHLFELPLVPARVPCGALVSPAQNQSFRAVMRETTPPTYAGVLLNALCGRYLPISLFFFLAKRVQL